MKIVPLTLKQSQEFIRLHHRHNKPPIGHKFSIGLQNEWGLLIGVVSAGRPIARHFDNGFTLEVNRTCTLGDANANSMLYGAVWKAGKAMGYIRCITYTQQDESGASLRGAGWVKLKNLPLSKSWSNPLRPRNDVESVGVLRTLWEIKRAETHLFR
jgi:hypothetical protein